MNTDKTVVMIYPANDKAGDKSSQMFSPFSIASEQRQQYKFFYYQDLIFKVHQSYLSKA